MRVAVSLNTILHCPVVEKKSFAIFRAKVVAHCIILLFFLSISEGKLLLTFFSVMSYLFFNKHIILGSTFLLIFKYLYIQEKLNSSVLYVIV